MELARYGILVNAIAPGYVETDFNREFLAERGRAEARGARADEAGRPGRGSRRRDAVAGLAGRRLHHRRGASRSMAATASPRSDPAAGRRRAAGAALARFLAAASGAGRARSPGSAPLAGGVDPGELGDRRAISRAAGSTGEQRLVLRADGDDRGAVEPRPDAGIRRAEGGVRGRRDGAGAAVRLRRPGGVRQAVFCDAPGGGQCGRASHHPRSGARTGTAGDRRAARARAGADSHDPPAAARSRLSAPYEETGPAPQIAGVPRLSRPPSDPAAGAGMGHALARNASAGARCRRCCATTISAPATTCSTATKLTGILDWEFAGWGDPHEDIGWFCCKGWRFARLDREAGGIAERAPFYRGYEGESGAVGSIPSGCISGRCWRACAGR